LSVVARARLWQGDAMRRFLPLLLVLLGGLPAQAQSPQTGLSPMTAEEFDAYSRGKTFYYGSAGEAYGVEKYLENRRVTWSFLDGQCSDGYWYESNGLICFEYEATPNPGPQCWSFFKGPSGLVAQFQGDPAQTTLYEVQNADKPMTCPGPEVGV
jgi:hypothetical protein